MAELYEILVPTHWVKLNDLIGTELVGSFEVFNAGREHDVVEVLYTESETMPTDDQFHKLIYRQKGVIIEFSSTPIWVKSELKQAKVIISEPQTDSPAKAYNVKYKGYNVQMQDQYSDMVNYYMRRLIRQLTIVSATINTYTIEVTDASLVTVGNNVCIQQGLRSFQARILSKLGNVLTLDTPLDFSFTAEAMIYECSFAMNVDASITPVGFTFNPVAGVKADIYGISIMIIDSTEMDDSKFGALPALAKGIVLRKKNAIHRAYFNCKTNGELKLVLGTTNPYTDKAGSGRYGFSAYYDFKTNNGVSIRLDGDLNEALELLLQDNLTGLDDMKVFVHGHFVED